MRIQLLDLCESSACFIFQLFTKVIIIYHIKVIIRFISRSSITHTFHQLNEKAPHIHVRLHPIQLR